MPNSGFSGYQTPSAYIDVPFGIPPKDKSKSMKSWAGVGISAITILGALKYNEIPDIFALCGIALIIVGVIILVFYSKMGTS